MKPRARPGIAETAAFASAFLVTLLFVFGLVN
jgi:hypothetical protein